MEKLLQTFKNLYSGEDIVKRHWYIVLMIILPSLAMAVVSFIDKDTPSFIVMALLLVAVVVLILSIIPLLTMSGFSLDFYKSRFDSEIGLPDVTWTTLPKGIKALPLYIVWTFYYLVCSLILYSIPISVFVYGLTQYKENIGIFIAVSVVAVMLFALMSIVIFLLTPFIGFVFIKYSQDFTYHKELFNPIAIIDYIKKSFKDTVVLTLKYVLVNLVISTVASIIISILGLFVIAYSLVMSMVSSADVYSLTFMSMLIIPTWILAVIQSYVVVIPGFAMADNLVEIYKKDIMEIE